MKSQIVLGSIVVLIIGAALLVPSSTLIDLQTNNQKLILEPEVNQLIYQHFDEKDYPDVKYMLISLYKDNDEVVAEIQQEIKQGNYELIFSKNRYMFVHILDD